jgi:anti-sigma factor RsiW
MGKVDSHHCSKFFCKLGDFLDGEMENECCTEMEQHIEGCEKCKIVIRTIRMTMNICHEHATEDVPETVKLRVRQVIRERFFMGKSIDEF